MDAFPDAPPVYRGPALEPGLDIWGAAYSWTGVQGFGYSGAQGGRPLAGLETVRRRRGPEDAGLGALRV